MTIDESVDMEEMADGDALSGDIKAHKKKKRSQDQEAANAGSNEKERRKSTPSKQRNQNDIVAICT